MCFLVFLHVFLFWEKENARRVVGKVADLEREPPDATYMHGKQHLRIAGQRSSAIGRVGGFRNSHLTLTYDPWPPFIVPKGLDSHHSTNIFRVNVRTSDVQEYSTLASLAPGHCYVLALVRRIHLSWESN